MYVAENQFADRHILEISKIIDENKITHMQIDSDVLEQVRDNTADFLRTLHAEGEIEEIKRT
jgi:hypothetical protein